MSEMPADVAWSLMDDRKMVRLQLPPLAIFGMPEPLRIHISFDAVKVDEILQQLTVLRTQMLPPPSRN